MKEKLKNIRKLLQVLYRYQTVERAFPTPYSPRLENDVEHSYMLAMLAWYIIDKEGLPLDHGKVLRYCLAHDLVEVYAGDTWTIGRNTKPGHSVATKERRESRAQERLKRTLPDFKALHEYIEGYKTRKDPESIFVYALDKIVANLTVSLHADKGKKALNKIGITLDMLRESKKGKVDLHPVTKALWEASNELLAQYDKKHQIFPVFHQQKKMPRRKRR
jgi:5'-deoxynucleotidase YfbR-like HD superfamily hydrolase